MDVDGVFRSFISVRHCYRLGRSIPVLSTSYKGMYGGHQIVVDGAPGKEGQGATPSYLKGGKSAPHWKSQPKLQALVIGILLRRRFFPHMYACSYAIWAGPHTKKWYIVFAHSRIHAFTHSRIHAFTHSHIHLSLIRLSPHMSTTPINILSHHVGIDYIKTLHLKYSSTSSSPEAESIAWSQPKTLSSHKPLRQRLSPSADKC